MDKSYTMSTLNAPTTSPFHYHNANMITNAVTTKSTWSHPYNDSLNVFHNPFGPAAVTMTEAKWYIKGKQIISTQYFCKFANHDNETTLLWILTYGDTLPSNPKDLKYLPVDLNP